MFPGVDFTLGTFTHINNVIPGGTSISGVDLTVSADVYDNGTFVTAVDFEFDFVHNETTNDAPCSDPNPAGSICDDIVTVTLADSTDTFISDGVEYTLNILGFLQGDTPINIFYSAEGGINQADIRAEFSVAAVPLPAAGWLLLGGLGGLAALRRKKKAA